VNEDSSASCVLPYRIATLIYFFDRTDKVLLMRRNREPNKGLWSPCGGKLETALGESPFQCGVREAREETGVALSLADLHLTGVVSEKGYLGEAHWLMFLFEAAVRLKVAPASGDEGEFRFFAKSELNSLPLPISDRDTIWPLFWRHRGGFFSAHCVCGPEHRYDWTIEQSNPAVS
jgi:8-oxo-dGTP diphosphatase